MLVLSFKKSEKCFITDSDGRLLCEVSVKEIGNGGIRLGFAAPQDVSVLREKVYLQVKESGIPFSRRAPE